MLPTLLFIKIKVSSRGHQTGKIINVRISIKRESFVSTHLQCLKIFFLYQQDDKNFQHIT